MLENKRPIITQNIVPVTGRGLSMQDLRELALHEPEMFVRKIQEGVDKDLLCFSDIKDIKALYQALADVRVKVNFQDSTGVVRAITTSAFPILTGTVAIKSINDAYLEVPTVGEKLVTEIDDNKKVTTIASIHNQDVDVDEVKELKDFPEIGSTEEAVEIGHKKNGRKVKFSLEMITENEIPNIVSRLNGIGIIASDWVEEQTLYRITDYFGCATSPTTPYVYRPAGTGGATLYSASANTPGTRAPLGTRVESNAYVDETNLETFQTRLMGMKNSRGKRINIPWSRVYLLVPFALIGKITKTMNSEYVPGVEAEKSNWGPVGMWHIPPERIITTVKMDDMSTSAWYGGDFKRQFTRKWKLRFEYVSLGQETQAYLNSQVAAQFRVAWDVEIGATDYVFVVQNLSGSTAPLDN